jgi:hypothetical protein
MENQLTGNRTVPSQHTTRTSITNQSTKLLKQANIICAHSIPILPKHDHSSMTNYVWDRSFSSKMVIHPRSTSPHFSTNPHFSQRRVETKSNQASQPSTIGCVDQSLSSFNQVQATARLKILKTVPSRQVASSRSSSSSGPRQDPNSLICRDLLLS